MPSIAPACMRTAIATNINVTVNPVVISMVYSREAHAPAATYCAFAFSS
jgi:hypothetical protein